MNYHQMINFLANPNANVGHTSHHNQGRHDTTNQYNESVRQISENQYQKTSNHQLPQTNHSVGSHTGSVQHKMEETSPKKIRNRAKFTDKQIGKLEGKFSPEILGWIQCDNF